MATTLEKISEMLTRMDIRHHVDHERNLILTGTATNVYEDGEGRKALMILIGLEENGEFIKFMVPHCYEYREGPHKEAVFQSCLMVSYETKMVQFEYDPEDGEVRAIIEFPLEDAELTERQLRRCLTSLVLILDEYHDMIATAIRTGRVVPIERESAASLFEQFQEFLRERRRRRAAGTELQLEE